MQCKEHVDVVKTPRFHFTFVATLLPASPKNKKRLCSRLGPEPPRFFLNNFLLPHRARARALYKGSTPAVL